MTVIKSAAQWGPNVVSANAQSFEAGFPGVWQLSGGQASAVGQSNGTTDPANQGTFSCKHVRGTGTGSMSVNGNTEIPVVANTLYVASYSVFTAVAAGVFHVKGEWYTSGQVYISDFSPVWANTAAVQNQWTYSVPSILAASPATAAFARFNFEYVSGMATGDTVFLDTILLARQLSVPAPVSVLQSVNRAAVR
jgi:hypothetical protein